MRYAQVNTTYYCGVDLHAKEMFITVMDKMGTPLLQQKMPNHFETFKQYLQPYLPDVAVGAESTCFYYWLADACRDAGIAFYLGHALYMKAISGGKVPYSRFHTVKLARLPSGQAKPLARAGRFVRVIYPYETAGASFKIKLDR